MLLGVLVLHALIRGGDALARLLPESSLGFGWRLGIESVLCSHPGVLAGVEGIAATTGSRCRPGRAHPKVMLAKVSVAWGSVAWFWARGLAAGLSLGYFFGLKGTKKQPCIERSGCPAQFRVALEGPPQ